MEATHTQSQPQWKRWIGATAAILMGALWLLAGIWKLGVISQWQLMMTQILVPVSLSLAATMAVIIGDLTAGVLLLRPAWRRLGGWFSTGLLAIFTAYFAINYETLKGADCSCFPWIERTVGPAFFWSESVMIALSVAAAWFAPPMRKLGTAVKAVAAIAAVSFVALAVDKLGPQPDADVPVSIQTDAGEFSLREGKVFVYFFNPLCPHCEDAAKRMAQLTWKAGYVAVPTQDPHFGPGFVEDTGLKDVKLSSDLDLLRERFPFGDVPYAVAINEGRVVERFIFFEDPVFTEQLRKLDFVE
jgi:uncharacterized membrane protein YphA (DoxX/SURF4 family)